MTKQSSPKESKMDCFVASAPRNDAWLARLLIAAMAHIMAGMI
jgi:hypothetical protein